MTAAWTTAPSALNLSGVRVVLSGRAALDGVDLDLDPGRLTVVAGANGAGKTTLLEVLAGTRRPTAGARRASGAIAFVPQRTVVSDRLPVTVRDVVTVGAWGRRGSWRRLDPRARGAVEKALERLGLQAIARQPFATLSGGQRQRSLLAQALARDADLLLLDEPTTGLDADSSQRIRDLMWAKVARGVAVVCVSHDPSVLASADRVVRLESGRVVTDTRARPRTPEQRSPRRAGRGIHREL